VNTVEFESPTTPDCHTPRAELVAIR